MAGRLQQKEEAEHRVHGTGVSMEQMDNQPQSVHFTLEAVMGEEDCTGMAGATFLTDNLEAQPHNSEDLRLWMELKVSLLGIQPTEPVLQAALPAGMGVGLVKDFVWDPEECASARTSKGWSTAWHRDECQIIRVQYYSILPIITYEYYPTLHGFVFNIAYYS
jgi:hypothetical protein